MRASRTFATTRRFTQIFRVLIPFLLASSFLVGAKPASLPASLNDVRTGDTFSAIPNLQTLHCPWFSVADDLVSMIAMKNATENEMNVYVTIRFGSSIEEDGSYEGVEPIRLGPNEGRTIDRKSVV